MRKCAKIDGNEQIYVAKIVKKRHVQQAINELRIFQYVEKHSNFISLFDVFDCPTEAIFILELFVERNSTNNFVNFNRFLLNFSAKHGDLQLVLESEGFLDEPFAANVVQQVLDAVAFLHDEKVVHLDIKVKKSPTDRRKMKLILVSSVDS